MGHGAYVRQVRRQHGSLLVALPGDVARALGLGVGSYVAFHLGVIPGALVLSPVGVDIDESGRDARDTVGGDPGKRL